LGKFFLKIAIMGKSRSQFEQALWFYAFPPTLNYANCLTSMADLYREMKRYEESQAPYLRAVSLYSTHFQSSLSYAICMSNFGWLYKEMRQLVQAEAEMKKGYECYRAEFRNNPDFTTYILNFGLLFEAAWAEGSGECESK